MEKQKSFKYTYNPDLFYKWSIDVTPIFQAKLGEIVERAEFCPDCSLEYTEMSIKQLCVNMAKSHEKHPCYFDFLTDDVVILYFTNGKQISLSSNYNGFEVF